MIVSRSEFLPTRGLKLHLRSWGPADAPLLLLLHGWMDNSASWQFMVEALAREWHCVAPDWRGFGQSEWAVGGIYDYADYLADLDVLLERLSPRDPVRIVGHSMGGNIGAWYAAARPERVQAFVNGEGFGLRASAAMDAPGHIRGWMEDMRKGGERRAYPDLASIIERIRMVSTRIDDERAHFIASHWAEQDAGGRYRFRADPGHRRKPLDLYRVDEWRAIWGAIKAPVLWIEADHSENLERHGLTHAALAARRNSIHDLTRLAIADSGHMVHWDQPERLAIAVEAFLTQ